MESGLPCPNYSPGSRDSFNIPVETWFQSLYHTTLALVCAGSISRPSLGDLVSGERCWSRNRTRTREGDPTSHKSRHIDIVMGMGSEDSSTLWSRRLGRWSGSSTAHPSPDYLEGSKRVFFPHPFPTYPLSWWVPLFSPPTLWTYVSVLVPFGTSPKEFNFEGKWTRRSSEVQ